MWNQLNRIILRDGIPKEIKIQGKVLQNNLDTPEGKKEAKAFINKYLPKWWRGWKG